MSIVPTVTMTPVDLSQPQLAESNPHHDALISAPPLPSRSDSDYPLELQNALQLVQELLVVSTGAAGVAIALGDAGGMQCVSSVGDAPPVGIALQLGNTLSGQCARTGQVVRFQRRPADSAMSTGPCSAVLAPVFLQGCVAGLVGIFSGDPEAFGNGSTSAIRHAASLIGLSMAKIQESRQLSLTGDIGWEAEPVRTSPRLPSIVPSNVPSNVRSINSPAPARKLLGPPCPNCGSYLLSGERICGACQTPVQ